MNRPPVGFELHLPERRRRAGTILAMGCCCCCCLHTVGSLIGAAIASASGRFDPVPPIPFTETDAEHAPTSAPVTGVKTVESAIQSGLPVPTRLEADEDNVSVSHPSERISAVALFWGILLGLSVAILLLIGVMGRRAALAEGLFMLALVLPAVQLGVIFLVSIILLFSRRTDNDYQFWQLAKIALGTIGGTVVGVLLMILIGFVMSATK